MRNKLRKYVDKLKPHFMKGGKLEKLHSVFDGFETFLFVPNATSKNGTHIHDAIDSKRTMIMVVVALIPALLFGMYNVGYQHYLAIGEAAGFWDTFLFGALAVLPIVVVSYVVGLGIEFIVAQIKGHEIQEGFLVTGFLIPLIVPVDTPLWMIAVATAFAVIFAKEVFGGTGMNIFNVALVTRAFLFFAYPTFMSGDTVWVRTKSTFGLGGGSVVDSYSGATVLGQVSVAPTPQVALTDITGNAIGFWDGFIGLIPGSIGETSVIAILIGAAILLITGVASWKTMFSVFAGGALMALVFNLFGPDTAAAHFPWYNHLVFGGFAFGAVFMATDPVTSARTETGKWIYGALIGAMAIIIRVLNPGYPEGMMLAILLMNIFAPLIDYYVVDANIKRRLKRAGNK
ncbi:Na(+)-translocating NADH-quinone reductase subunit B [bioreactor metagenome]|jgi:Na+-transporting NADH:ubiquinone oxidoreductase subunit B|uniref:Na(+)-translocating NADH-quinone reductase subunit B n=1 Tax=bioreactor metagenome TaxID=1076179 RepID=A0A644WD78_9ZZZZ|nr:NADH:ubiquinone reductase (Na(+)-transporting) subunit B [Paludibacter sp.]